MSAKDEDWQIAIVHGRHAVQQIFEITGTIEPLPFTTSTNGARNSDPHNLQLPHRPYDIELAPPGAEPVPRRSDLTHRPIAAVVTLTSPVRQPR